MAARAAEICELASGIDALYLSLRTIVPGPVLALLQNAREAAEENDQGIEIRFGGVDVVVQPSGFGKYKYKITHPYGLIGITPSKSLPAIRVQPRAEFLHGVGALDAAAWFEAVVGSECGPAIASVSRLDLHTDVQGWTPIGDDRHRFVSRADTSVLHEVGGEFTGFEFGRRTSRTVGARIYDKTVEMKKSGAGYLPEMWGEQFDPEKPVLRVEFELGRVALKQFSVDTPAEAVEAAGSLWRYCTESWLTLRSPTEDSTKSRWPISVEWSQIQLAQMSAGAHGLERMYAGRSRGEIAKLLPGLFGTLARFAALQRRSTVNETVVDLVRWSAKFERETGVPFTARVVAKAQEMGLP